MTDNLDTELVNVPCPRCDRLLSVQLGRLRQRRSVACWSCGNVFEADPAPVEKALSEAQTWLLGLGPHPSDW